MTRWTRRIVGLALFLLGAFGLYMFYASHNPLGLLGFLLMLAGLAVVTLDESTAVKPQKRR